MNYTVTSTVAHWQLNNEWVILRADLSVPLHDGSLVHDHKLQAIKPTIDLIHERGGRIVLMTHMGRPLNADERLSTKQLMPWFTAQGYTVRFANTVAQARRLQQELRDPNTIILLENLRFFPGEQQPDVAFAKKLATLGDYFVQDAFGVLHRTDSSVTLLPEQFTPDRRTVGLLVEHELQKLHRLLAHPVRPFVLIMGGGKLAEKIPVITHLLDVVDTILLCPALSFIFAQAMGNTVGKSLVDETMQATATQIMQTALEKQVTIRLPIDYQVAEDNIDGPLSMVPADDMPVHAVGIAIGPQTAQLYAQEIHQAKMIFFNGINGFLERPDTLDGTKQLFTAMASTNTFSVVGGGDSAAAAYTLGFGDAFDHISTGGGATLAYLSGIALPGLKYWAEAK